MPLTPEQKNSVREVIAAKNAKQSTAQRERMVYEEKRDARAYELVEANAADRRANKATPELSFGEAQALATAELDAAPEKKSRRDKPTDAPAASAAEPAANSTN